MMVPPRTAPLCLTAVLSTLVLSAALSRTLLS